MVVIYLFLALFLFKKAHLSVTGGDVFLHGLKAELIAKRGIFGTQYIQITSNTEKGYHRLKVTKDQIALADWNLLLGKCIKSLCREQLSQEYHCGTKIKPINVPR